MTQEEIYKAQADLNAQTVIRQANEIRRLEGVIARYLPDYGTPNWCPKCSPKNLGYCQCEIASNE